ncbi:hypothetical protein DEM27_06530 [Metarhizobium album]|uniref:Uncharacterized protein n=1 Tax=Metarhizobium album TaxID=2182425 RepID=A0A2U2DVR4_9HYPH|nr:hypothetical protein [Rhizobium album]PWE57289.1 hypothetical protein DEM27_06530 [Rhizobium album]
MDLEHFIPARRGRPPKVKDEGNRLTALEQAMQQPLPPEIFKAAKTLVAAYEVVDALVGEYRKVSESARIPPDIRQKNAERAYEQARDFAGYARDVLADARRELRDKLQEFTEIKTAMFADRRKKELEAAVAAAEKSVSDREADVQRAHERQEAARVARDLASVDPVAAAQAALVSALTRREAAAMGAEADNVPSLAEIDRLQAALDSAKKFNDTSIELRVEALKSEILRQAEKVRAAHTALLERLHPFREKWLEAANTQIAEAATMLAQTQQLAELFNGYAGVPAPFQHARLGGAGTATGDPTLKGAEDVLSVFATIRAGTQRLNPYL